MSDDPRDEAVEFVRANLTPDDYAILARGVDPEFDVDESYDDEVIGLADVAGTDDWPAALDPAKGWLRCKRSKGFFCSGVLHVECRPDGFVMPEGYR